jgi:hypothetical protein
VLVLAGRYLALAGAQLQTLAAADADAALEWLGLLLLGPEPAPQALDSISDVTQPATWPLVGLIQRVKAFGPREVSELLQSNGSAGSLKQQMGAFAEGCSSIDALLESPETDAASERALSEQVTRMTRRLIMRMLLPLQCEVVQSVQRKQEAEQLKRQLADMQARLESIQPKPQGRKMSVKQRLAHKLAAKKAPATQQAGGCSPSEPGTHSTVDRNLLDLMAAYAWCLDRTAALLCSLLPSRFCCNKPACSSLSTASEGFLLVRGQSCVCGGCLMGRRPVLAPTFCTAAR